jgi:sulfite exporter TauE/SafE
MKGGTEMLYITGIGLGVIGVVLGLASRVLLVQHSLMFIAGVFLVASGVLIVREARRKKCPQCAGKLNSKAVRCRYCAFIFRLTAADS